MLSTISDSDLLVKWNPYRMSTFIAILTYSHLHSTYWAVWWEGRCSHWTICLYNAQSRLDLPPSHAEARHFSSFQFSLWSWWSYALASAVCGRVSSSWCHPKAAWRPQRSSFNYVVEPDLRWISSMVFWMGWVNCPPQFTGLFRICRKD